MSAPLFHYRHRVTYSECTLGNHVYYAKYLDLLEAARGEFFRSIGAPLLELQAQETFFPVLECRVSYKGMARYDDLLAIEVWVSLAQRVRVNFSYRIVNQKDELILEAATFHVCAGLNEKPKRIPEELLRRLEPHVRVETSKFES